MVTTGVRIVGLSSLIGIMRPLHSGSPPQSGQYPVGDALDVMALIP
jgi:hypothetical protein